MKLNLACGVNTKYKFPNWVNIDIRSGAADLVCDITNLPADWKGKVEKIYASHILEHFPKSEIISTLQYWRSFMKKNAEIYIVVPNAIIIAKAIIKGFDEKNRIALSVKQTTPILTQIYGLNYQDKSQNSYMKHYMLFDKDSLKKALISSGFSCPIEYKKEEDISIKFGYNNDAAGPFSLYMKAKNI